MINISKRFEVEAQEDWLYWIERIPELKFRATWKVKIMPPVFGALVRFTVTKGRRIVSVYLDVHEALGYFEGPYWEAYNGDEPERFALEDTKGLLGYITKYLEEAK